MGRELKRVPLDFKWPMNEPWSGYLNNLYDASTECPRCKGSGYSLKGRSLKDKWYGRDAADPFRPEDNGSVPFTVETPAVRAFAERNVTRSPEYYGRGERAIIREAERLLSMWNVQWCHHLNQEDVAALVEGDRLYDLTHTWTAGKGWRKSSPFIVPTPAQVNEWSLDGMGHDSINQWICVKAACERLGVPHLCQRCDGECRLWPSQEAKAKPEVWIARLSTVLLAVDAMDEDERRAAFSFMKDKYSREWPSSSY